MIRDLWSRRARCVSVHDGDSLTLYIDDGRDRYSTEFARLKNVYAPELKEVGGDVVREFVIDWIEDARFIASRSDWPLVVTTVRTRTDKDASTLGRYLYLVEDTLGNSLNDAIMQFVKESGYSGGVGS